ncbi:hypothetical protein TPA0909_54750 [Streptomyces albus]|nr:hypothetical protein TPA0909_54750 [Streptomyces albus]
MGARDANTREMARPMPAPAPVTTTVRAPADGTGEGGEDWADGEDWAEGAGAVDGVEGEVVSVMPRILEPCRLRQGQALRAGFPAARGCDVANHPEYTRRALQPPPHSPHFLRGSERMATLCTHMA